MSQLRAEQLETVPYRKTIGGATDIPAMLARVRLGEARLQALSLRPQMPPDPQRLQVLLALQRRRSLVLFVVHNQVDLANPIGHKQLPQFVTGTFPLLFVDLAAAHL